MLNSEDDWKRGTRRNRIVMALSAVGMGVAWPLADALSIDKVALVSAFSGILATTVMMELLVFRKPKSEPSPQEQAQMETRQGPIMLISALTTWGFMSCFVVVQAFDIPTPWQTILIGVGAALLLASIALLPKLLRQMRLSRVTPALNDERSQYNMNRAYRGAFLLMFQASFLGGAGMMLGLFSLPPQVVAFGIGILGISSLSILSVWFEWRDAAE